MTDQEKIQELSKALAFYADHRNMDEEYGNYRTFVISTAPMEADEYEEDYDQGQRAQKALCKVYGHKLEFTQEGPNNFEPIDKYFKQKHCVRCNAWLDSEGKEKGFI